MPMPVITTKVEVHYGSVLMRGLLEATADGTIVRDRPDDHDRPFLLQLQRVTVTRFFDSRGERHSEKQRVVEDLALVTVAEAGEFARALVSDIGYCYAVAERRVLTADPRPVR